MGEPLSEIEDFQALLRRVRAGDGQAAAELVRRYELATRRTARVWPTDTRLNRLLDSKDICQSVLASFFVRAGLGQYELETPAQWLNLLATMTSNKLFNQVKSHRSIRRDYRRIENRGAGNGSGERSVVGGAEGPASPDRTPSSEVATRELREDARRRLSAGELSLLEHREHGREWTEIAAELGSSPEAIRKRLACAIDRVAHELGLDQPDS
jgi:RNA polymerase sigma-70 factor (ECF subfamily)